MIKRYFSFINQIGSKTIYPFLEGRWLPNRQEQHSHQVQSVKRAADRGGFDFDLFDGDADGMAKSENFAETSLVKDSYHASSSFVSSLSRPHLCSWRAAGLYFLLRIQI